MEELGLGGGVGFFGVCWWSVDIVVGGGDAGVCSGVDRSVQGVEAGDWWSFGLELFWEREVEC